VNPPIPRHNIPLDAAKLYLETLAPVRRKTEIADQQSNYV
jgi:hypothetical protein